MLIYVLHHATQSYVFFFSFLFLSFVFFSFFLPPLPVPGAIMGDPTHNEVMKKYLTCKAIQDPIHDEVMRKRPDNSRPFRIQGTLQVGPGLYPTLYPPPFSAVVFVRPAVDSCVAC